MKFFIRNIAINAFVLSYLPKIISGVEIHGGITTLIIGGFVLSILLLILKPILSALRFPLNIATMGIYTIFVNFLILYLLTVFVPDIVIKPFTLQSVNILGFISPEVALNHFFSLVVAAIILATIVTGIKWLID